MLGQIIAAVEAEDGIGADRPFLDLMPLLGQQHAGIGRHDVIAQLEDFHAARSEL